MFGYRVVAFGDRPAALALELAKELAAEKARELDPQAARQLTRNSLVDDVGGGGTEDQVSRMRGVLGEEGYSGTLPKMLGQCGFKAKALVRSGSSNEKELEAMGGRFLGLGYDPETDELISRVAPYIRMTRKRSKQRRQDNETIDEEWMENLKTGGHVLTKRRVLAFVMSQYDPHGIRAPMMLTAKLLLRKLYGAGNAHGWDDPLAAELQLEWELLLAAMLHNAHGRHSPSSSPVLCCRD